jgi:glycine cleavage system regulatory protein
MITSLVVTVIGADRPGLVSLLSDRAMACGANWAESRMANLAGQFAGIVHFQVPAENAKALAAALRELETQGLSVLIAKSEAPASPSVHRRLKLDLVGHDRPGIIRDVSRALAERGVSIAELHTQITSGAMSGESMFQANALLIAPAALSTGDLRGRLEALANEFMVDVTLDETAGG